MIIVQMARASTFAARANKKLPGAARLC